MNRQATKEIWATSLDDRVESCDCYYWVVGWSEKGRVLCLGQGNPIITKDSEQNDDDEDKNAS